MRAGSILDAIRLRRIAPAAAVLIALWPALPAGAAAAELVMFRTDSCPYCAAWEREVGVVYHKTRTGGLAPLRRVDLYQRRPADLKQIDGVIYTPTFVLLQAGREVGRILGYPGEDHFWGLLDELVGRLEAGPES